MNRIVWCAAFVVIAVSPLTGCSGQDQGVKQPSAASTEPTSSSPIATYPGPPVGYDAAIEGTLQLVNDCVVLGAGGDYVVPVFPAEGDLSWNEDVLTWNGKEYEIGDKVSFGGGGTASADSFIPTGCAGVPTILIGA